MSDKGSSAGAAGGFIKKVRAGLAAFNQDSQKGDELILGVFLSVMALWTLPTFNVLAKAGLDPSWEIGMSWAYLKQMQIGTDIVFSHGPLYFLDIPLVIDYRLWVLAIAFTIVRHVTFFLCLFFLIRQLSVKWYAYLLIAPALLYVPINYDTLPLITLSTFLLIIFLKEKPGKTELVLMGLVGFVLAATSLIKYNILWTGIATIFLATILFACYRKKVNYIAYLSATCLALMIVLWLLSGQSLLNAWDFLRNGLEISLGYNSAMVVVKSEIENSVMLIAICSTILIAIYSLIKKKTTLIAFFVLNAAILLTSYKHGIVRQEYVFQITYLTILSFVMVLLINEIKIREASIIGLMAIIVLTLSQVNGITSIYTTGIIIGLFFAVLIAILQYQYGVKGIGSLTYACMFLAVFSLALLSQVLYAGDHKIENTSTLEKLSSYGQTAGMIMNPYSFDSCVNKEKADIARIYGISGGMRETIGDNSIDILPYDIALAWTYDMNWTPRPVFQSYSAYTATLDSMNSRHFTGLDAPQYILYSYDSIDGRYPLYDEPATFRNILLNYNYSGRNNQFILLSHDGDEQNRTEEYLGTVDAEMGETIYVPDYNGYVFGHVYCENSLKGKIDSLLFEPDRVYIRFITGGNETSKYYRIVPDTAKNGIYLSYYVTNVYELSGVFKDESEEATRIQAIQIDTAYPMDYSNHVKIVFTGIPYS